MVESQPSKLLVAGSIPVSRSNLRPPKLARESRARAKVSFGAKRGGGSAKADVAQLAERVLGKDEVTGSIPVIGSNLRSLRELRLVNQRRLVRRSRGGGGLASQLAKVDCR